MAIDKTKGEIGIYGVLKNDTDAGVIAYAEQIKDNTRDEFQSTINNKVYNNSNSIANHTERIEIMTMQLQNKASVNDIENVNNKITDAVDYLNKEIDSKLETTTNDINTQLETKADISDLSNVKAEEVIDAPLLDEINTLTREEIKKDLFIDLWNEACGEFGGYNAETGFFELNGLTDITYKEALGIYRQFSGTTTATEYNFIYSKARTCFPIKSSKGNFGIDECNNLFSYSDLEVIRFENSRYVNIGEGSFCGCSKLTKILGGDLRLTNSADIIFKRCTKLKEVSIVGLKKDLFFADSPFLSLESFQCMITNATNTSPITITVHPDVYAKLTGDTTNAAASALTPEEATQWQQLVTDAAAKNITFATA